MAEANQDRNNNQAIEQELRLSRKIYHCRCHWPGSRELHEGGVLPCRRMVQVKTEIAQLIKQHLKDSSGALQIVLQNWIAANEKTHQPSY